MNAKNLNKNEIREGKELTRSERARQLLEVGDKELTRSERANWIIEAMEFLGLIEFTDDQPQ